MFKILEAEQLSANVYKQVILAPRVAKSCEPGQFIILRVDENGERIPLTICDYDREAGTVTIVFQPIGVSTNKLLKLKAGDSIADFVGPLGRPSELVTDDFEEVKKKRVVFIAGGVGTAMLEKLVSEGHQYDLCVAIGPMIMMKFACLTTKKLGIPTVVSMNPIMVDGTGMCGACRVMVGDEVKFACVDGPEFDGHLIDFDQAMKRSAMYKAEEGRRLLEYKEGKTHHGGCGNCGGDK